MAKASKPKAVASSRRVPEFVTAVAANEKGEVFDLEGYAAVKRLGDCLCPVTRNETLAIPHGSELMFLPDRSPVFFNLSTRALETKQENPYAPGERLFPVAVFNSPGYLLTGVSAYEERPGAGWLPLFSYGACGWSHRGICSVAVRVDRDRRQDLRLMPRAKVTSGVHRMRKRMPRNRLARHLETCALTYGCPAAKNFFVGRCEAPLPTSPACNARCRGCLSLQTEPGLPSSQERIAFTPSPDEIAEVALEHLSRVPEGVVSFGQGCEGEPLLAADVIIPAIRRIRARTGAGTINLNTNASRPDKVKGLIEAGLDSVRVSMNSVRQPCYDAYFRPVRYGFSQVLETIDLVLASGKWVSLNYLNCPGFTDCPEEASALLSFLRARPVHMIQWRNLNFDPLRYWKAMSQACPCGPPLGMKTLLSMVRDAFPALRHGYFNPPKEQFHAP